MTTLGLSKEHGGLITVWGSGLHALGRTHTKHWQLHDEVMAVEQAGEKA